MFTDEAYFEKLNKIKHRTCGRKHSKLSMTVPRAAEPNPRFGSGARARGTVMCYANIVSHPGRNLLTQ